MREKKNKPRCNAQLQTFNCQQSCIDIFSKVEGLFLQKFFRYNLSDYFQDQLLNLEQGRKLKDKYLKQLASECFITKSALSLIDFEQKVNSFYSHRGENIENAETPFSFKKVFSNCEDKWVGKEELVFVRVRMMAEVQKIQSFPRYFYKELELNQRQMGNVVEKEEQQLLRELKRHGKKTIHLFLVYFGDINFHLFSKQDYALQSVKFFSRTVQVRINVFYVSKIALLACFRRINRIQNMEYINDLLIQLYEFKREKTRNKRLRNSKTKHFPPVRLSSGSMFPLLWKLRWVGLSVVMAGIGALIFKFFF